MEAKLKPPGVLVAVAIVFVCIFICMLESCLWTFIGLIPTV